MATGLPHWDNSIAATDHYEPVFLNQFEVLITPPTAITGVDANEGLLIQQVISVDGLPEFFTKAGVKQKYKFAERAYASAVPETTLANLTLKFEVNLDKSNNMYVYNTFRAWSDLIYDPLTGRQGLKKDYADASMDVHVFNKAGDIFRTFKFESMFISEPINKMSLDYTKDDIYRMEVKLIADKTKETRVGQINI